MNETDIENILFDTVEEITTSGKIHLDETYIKVLKSYCKLSSKNIEIVFNMLIKQLEKEHAQVRYSCVLLADELFCCSHIFRGLLLNDLRKFFALTLETEPLAYPMPMPVCVARDLKQHTLKVFYNWYKRFAHDYMRLQLGFDYLKNVRCINFNDISITTSEQQQEIILKEEKEKRIRKTKLEQLDMQLNDSFENMLSTINQLENCYRLLIPNSGACSNNEMSFADSLCSSSTTNLGSETGLVSKSYALSIRLNGFLTIEENISNSDIIKAMQDLYIESVKQLLQVKKWLNTLTKYDSTNQGKITKILNLKNLLTAVQEKYHELEIIEQIDEENDFVDVPEKELASGSSSSSGNIPPILTTITKKDSINQVNLSNKRACGFLLSNGNRCLRTDNIKCPFHGKIVERDMMGIPINEKDKLDELKKRQACEVRQQQIIQKEIDEALGTNLSKRSKKKRSLNKGDKQKARYSRLMKIKTNKLINNIKCLYAKKI